MQIRKSKNHELYTQKIFMGLIKDTSYIKSINDVTGNVFRWVYWKILFFHFNDLGDTFAFLIL